MVSDDDDLKETPLPQLLKQLAQEMTTLVRKEIELAKAEVRESGKKAGVGAGMFGAAGILGFLALGSLTAFIILLLAKIGLDAWVAALAVAFMYGALAGALALQGKNKVKHATPPTPQTVETVKDRKSVV